MSRNRLSTTCDCGLDFSFREELGKRLPSNLIASQEYLNQINWKACPYSLDGRYKTLYGKIICPLCRTEFVGWFRGPDLPKIDGPSWQVYDSSYWSSYNDEPGKEDKENWRDPSEILKKLSSDITMPSEAGRVP